MMSNSTTGSVIPKNKRQKIEKKNNFYFKSWRKSGLWIWIWIPTCLKKKKEKRNYHFKWHNLQEYCLNKFSIPTLLSQPINKEYLDKFADLKSIEAFVCAHFTFCQTLHPWELISFWITYKQFEIISCQRTLLLFCCMNPGREMIKCHFYEPKKHNSELIANYFRVFFKKKIVYRIFEFIFFIFIFIFISIEWENLAKSTIFTHGESAQSPRKRVLCMGWFDNICLFTWFLKKRGK